MDVIDIHTTVPMRDSATSSPYTDLRVRNDGMTRCKHSKLLAHQKQCKFFLSSVHQNKCTFDKCLLDVCDYTPEGYNNIKNFNLKK